MDDKYLDIDYLKSLNADPEWFGLGFIQLKISPTKRIHFWHPELKGNVEHPHNHRYNFTSKILRGSIKQTIYRPSDNQSHGDHHIFEVNCQEDSKTKLVKRVSIKKVFSTTMIAGQEYSLDMDEYHTIESSDAVTLLSRPNHHQKEMAQVLQPCDERMACPFEKKISTYELWKYITDIVSKDGYHKADIEKGNIGDLSKIREEIDELIDSKNQDVRIMELVELSDIVGAIEAYMERCHHGYNIDDLLKMSAVTRRVFKNGHR